MNQEQQLIVDTTHRILTDLCDKSVVDASEAGNWPSELWRTLEETGLTLAGIPGDSGGSGGSYADSLLAIRKAASFAAPVPMAETFIAATLLVQAGQKVPLGPMTVCTGDLQMNSESGGVKIMARLSGIAFAQNCLNILLVNDDSICLVPANQLKFEEVRNLAGEIRASSEVDRSIEGVSIIPLESASEKLLQLGAITRVNMMSGAMTSILAMSVQYALDRIQFGRPIAGFQAVQQQLAILAGEVAACQRAADSLLTEPDVFDIAVAKSRVGEAVTLVADIAHQVHGAMGYTMEHALNLYTRRLWDWRDEYGKETLWQARLGHDICASGADQLWSKITNAS